jgi:NADP-dependent aldehyde dehydrogenase
MLTPRISDAFTAGVERVAQIPGVRRVAASPPDPGIHAPGTPTLFETDLTTFTEHRPELSAEIFGAVTLLIRTPADRLTIDPLVDLEGQLTVTIHAADADKELAAELVDRLELRAGRIVFNGWSTGLEVNDAVIHGGPWPATSAPQTTSVGTRAIERFLRPVAYQNTPEGLLPRALRDEASGVWRRVDGSLTQQPVTH